MKEIEYKRKTKITKTYPEEFGMRDATNIWGGLFLTTGLVTNTTLLMLIGGIMLAVGMMLWAMGFGYRHQEYYVRKRKGEKNE